MFGDGPRRRHIRRITRSCGAGIREAPPVDLFVIAVALPLTLGAIHLVPGTDTWQLSLATESVFQSAGTLWTAYASSFVHVDRAHLLNNVGSYLLVMAALYPLSVAAGWRRQLFMGGLAILAVVPLASAWVSVLVLGPLTDVPAAGFSDVTAALLGFLLVVWFVALERLDTSPSPGDSSRDGHTTVDSPRVDPRWSGVVFAVSIGLAFGTPGTVGYFPAMPLVALACFALGVLFTGSLIRQSGRPRPVSVVEHHEFCFVYAAAVLAAGFVGSMLLVPMGMNVWAHLTGYVLGFTIPFVAFVLLDG